MKVGIIQSNYIPWRGYFDFIHECDLFILHEDLQYTKGDWRNRNRIKTPRGLEWLTVPVKHHHISQLICDTEISYADDWQKDHARRFQANYRTAPHCQLALDILLTAFSAHDILLSRLNQRLIEAVCGFLHVTTPIALSTAFGISGKKTERLIQLMKAVGGTTYLSGPAAKSYLDESMFQREGMRIEWKRYEYPGYSQPFGAFSGEVSVLDLLANVGLNSPKYIWEKLL